jgi:type II secretory pathway pseudopilin PulG
LVVIAIIALLASMLVASITKSREKARDARRISDLNNLVKAAEVYYSKYGLYPCGSVGSSNAQTAVDGTWFHSNTPNDSFLDSKPLGAYTCPSTPTIGMVQDGLIRPSIVDPGSKYYIYEVSNDRQSFVFYVSLESSENVSKMLNDNGFDNCFYEIGNGKVKIDPSILC